MGVGAWTMLEMEGSSGQRLPLRDAIVLEADSRTFLEPAHPACRSKVRLSAHNRETSLSPSILLEVKASMTNVKTNKDMVHVGIVDPEIGSMAIAAQSANVEFGYLHLVSNNLEKVYACFDF